MKRLPVWLWIVIWLVIIAGAGYGWNQYRIWSDNRLSATMKTPTPSPSPSVSASPTGSPHSSISPTPSSKVAIANCTAAELSLAIGTTNGTAGTSYTPLVFTNISAAPCSMNGFPGVSLVTATGVTLGSPATRDLTKMPETTVLAPGQKAHATIGIHDSGAYPPGTCSATSTDLRVYPPNQTTYLQAAFAASYCGNWPVDPIAAGISD